MNEVVMAVENVNAPQVSAKPKRRWHGHTKKRLKFCTPRNMPRGVKDLWESATPEEQERAHRVCTQILSMWLGRVRRHEVAKELSMAPLRVWQLSQQALSGMLAGLLHQPKRRRAREEIAIVMKDDDPKVLKKRLAEKDKTIADQQELIRLLSSIPKPRSESVSIQSTPAAKTRPTQRASRTKSGAGIALGNADAAPR